jgi:hypothetical protein
MKTNKTAVSMISVTDIGRVNRMMGEPPDNSSDCLRLCSNMGPKITPRISGVEGQWRFFITYPKIPKPTQATTSNRLFRTEKAPTKQTPRTTDPM